MGTAIPTVGPTATPTTLTPTSSSMTFTPTVTSSDSPTSQISDYLTMYGPSLTMNVTTYDEAVYFCNEHGGVLASKSQWCPSGMVVGGQKEDNQWAPILDGYNEWVQIGSYNGEDNECQSYDEIVSGYPSWGISDNKNIFEGNFILCYTSTTSSPTQSHVAKSVVAKSVVAVVGL